MTFTDEIDAFTNDISDHGASKHGDRTAVIDLLNVSASSQCNNENISMDDNVMHFPEYPTETGSDLNFQNTKKGFQNMKNGVIANQDFHMASTVHHNCKKYSDNSIDNASTLGTRVGNLASNHHERLNHVVKMLPWTP